jgi:cytidine deaminase
MYSRLTPQGTKLESYLAKSWDAVPYLGYFLDKHGDDLREHAGYMAGHGVSHRPIPIQVGAAAIGIVNRTKLYLLEGANFTPHRKAPKHCAEMALVAMSNGLGVEQLPAIWVAGPDIDNLNLELNNLCSDTLDPCSPCRQLLRDYEPAGLDLAIYTSRVGTDIQEEKNLRQMRLEYLNVQAPPSSHDVAMAERRPIR